jgi:hypothetical protein
MTYTKIDRIYIKESKQVKEDEMGKVHSTHERNVEFLQGFGGKTRRKETARKT